MSFSRLPVKKDTIFGAPQTYLGPPYFVRALLGFNMTFFSDLLGLFLTFVIFALAEAQPHHNTRHTMDDGTELKGLTRK